MRVNWEDLRDPNADAIEELQEDYGPFNICRGCGRWLPESWMTMTEYLSSVEFSCENCAKFVTEIKSY